MKDTENRDRYYTGAGDIYSVFRSLESEHAPITVQFNGKGNFYNSLIVDAFFEKKIILLDEITPSEGHHKAVKKIPFSIHASLNGIKIYCKNIVISEEIDDESGILYRAFFPRELLYLQRRDAFRARVPMHMKIEVICRGDNREMSLMARVLNISATGLLIESAAQVHPELEVAEILDSEILILNDGERLKCLCKVAHARYDKVRERTIFGCQFLDLDVSTQIRISRFVTFLQREEIDY